MIVSGVKSSEDAEYFAGILGTQTVNKETVQVQNGLFGQTQTGMKSVRRSEEYVVHPNLLKSLQQGEVFTVSRTVDPRWALVKVPQAKEFTEHELVHSELIDRLKEIRKATMSESKDRYIDLEKIGRTSGLTRAKPATRDTPTSEEETTQPESGPVLWS